MPPKPTIVELDREQIAELLRRAEELLDAEDYATIKTLVESYAYLADLVGDKNITLGRLRKMLFGASTEKTASVVGSRTSSPAAAHGEPSPATGDSKAEADAGNGSSTSEESRVDGHGRHGVDDYPGAATIEVRHESLQPGDRCPKCEAGTLYDTGRPGVLVRLAGQAPVGATILRLQKLRCGLCGVLFTAAGPTGTDGEEKYDATVGSMIALLKYGAGMPFHRNEKLQANLGIPLPASTQWELVEGLGERAEPVFDELIRQAACGEVLHNDDTGVTILEVIQARNRPTVTDPTATGGDDTASPDAPAAGRTGTFTTGIVATHEGHKIALFFSGRQHAGENLKDVLARRAAKLPPPIQMCDALSRNLPGELKTILGHCLAHGRRRFVDVIQDFPEACRHVLESLAMVYHQDAQAKERNLSPQDRLLWHQTESGPVMEDLHAWLAQQIDQRRVEPNSGLGKAISYLLRHWKPLTLFLRVAGAPLDNNVCEQALKKAILHRKNALFYKTRHGAHVGDLFMSLIHTCELGGINPFDYLTELDRHAPEAGARPQAWLPWNYRETLSPTASPAT